MKKILLLTLFIGMSQLFAQTYPVKTIIQIQTISMDSLLKADTLGIGAGTRWTIQASPFYHASAAQRETISVVALVVVQPKKITYTASGRTLCLADTGVAGSQPFSGLFVRFGGDSSQADAAGFYNIERGDIIKITGYVDEFPTNNMNSISQFVPIPTLPIQILSSGNPIPAPPVKSIADFNVGTNPGGSVRFSTGEPWEAKEVTFTNLTVTGNVNTTRGTWFVTDDNGNQLSMYDWSYHFTIGHGTIVTPGDPNYIVPPVGTRIDTLRGYIATSSGGESTRGYRICPILPTDLVLGQSIKPSVTTHRRNPVVVGKDTMPTITAKIYRQVVPNIQSANMKSVKVTYRTSTSSVWIDTTMAGPNAADSTYSVRLPKMAAGTTVYYFINVADSIGQKVLYANSGSLTQYDSSKGFFFYKVFDRSAQPVLAPQDVQWTPFSNGRSPYIGADDMVGGVITADTSLLRLSPLSGAGTSAWYMQSGDAPFSGLWIVGPDNIMGKLKLGDSVVVTGSIQENFEVTRVADITSAEVISEGNVPPDPVKLQTGRFSDAATNGNLDAEPYEGMLVQFDSVTVTDVSPVFDQPTEFWVSNGGTEPVLVRRDGRHTYSNVPADTAVGGLTIVHVGDKFQSLTGIIYFSSNRYKVTPRKNSDWVGYQPVTGVKREPPVASSYSLDQNFPNPFNPSTTLRYSILQPSNVVLKVYNVVGQEVATLVNEYQSNGVYTVKFDASKLSSGMYFYRITAGNFVQVKKMLLLK